MSWSPARICCSMVHSSHALAPSSSTAPPGMARHARPAKRSVPLADSCAQACSWSALSTLTPKRTARRSRGQVVDEWAMQTDTSGGSSDTGANELAAMPTGRPSTSADTAVTPLGKALNTLRSRCMSSTWLLSMSHPPQPRAPLLLMVNGDEAESHLARRQPTRFGSRHLPEARPSALAFTFRSSVGSEGSRAKRCAVKRLPRWHGSRRMCAPGGRNGRAASWTHSPCGRSLGAAIRAPAGRRYAPARTERRRS